MKKIITLCFCSFLFYSVFSQITFTIGDVPTTGTSQRVAMDTLPLPVVNFGSKGANQIYDFSNFTLFKYDTVEFRTPTNNQTSICPSADVATTADGTNFLLTNTDNANNKLTLEGFEGQVCPGQTITAAYSTKPDLFRFPTTYQTNFAGNGYLQKTVSASQVCQSFPVTQVRLTTNVTYTDTIDGWGKVITPVGAYKCLRKQRKETTTTTIEAQVLGSWSTVDNSTKTTVRYTYVTKEAKGSVINFNYDTGGVLHSVTWSMVPPTAPVANFSFNIGANGLVTFTDLSDFYPTQWSWTFGDGGTSTLQNPTHTYLANNTYNVCLTATNAGGSSVQVCKQVSITGLAVTPVADFNWANPSGGLVNFTDQSTNTPTSWSWTFGDGATSTQQNPNHVYSANNTYNVCLTAANAAGSHQHCENVIVSGITAANNAPVATDDTLSVVQGNFVVIHVAGNDVDPDNDNICLQSVWGTSSAREQIGGSCDMVFYLPDTCFTGTQTFYYSICDNGSPVLCDTAQVTATVYPNILYTATADFSLSPANYNCDTLTVANASANYSNSIWEVYRATTGTTDTLFTDSLVYLAHQVFTGQVCLTVEGKCNTVSHCDTLDVACTNIPNEVADNILLFPNPANTVVQLDFSRSKPVSNDNYVVAEVYNIAGEKCISVRATTNIRVTIPVDELTPGMYFITLLQPNGQRIVTRKFVKAE